MKNCDLLRTSLSYPSVQSNLKIRSFITKLIKSKAQVLEYIFSVLDIVFDLYSVKWYDPHQVFYYVIDALKRLVPPIYQKIIVSNVIIFSLSLL